jgi:amino acid adenylation domain-containing protein
MQAGLLYETLNGHSGNYVQQVVVTCHEPLDSEALRGAWLTLVQRHGALRTSFVIGESARPLQQIHDDVDLAVVVADWHSLEENERASRWRELLMADRQTPFEPAYAPLMRVAICRLAADETRLLWSYHHAILDGRSRVTLLRELFELYRAATTDQALDWRAPPPFAQFAQWAADHGRDPATEAFWRRVLADIDAPTPAPGTVPADRAPVSLQRMPGMLSSRIDSQLSNDLRQMAAANEVTAATVLQAVYALMLAQEDDNDDLLFATTRAGRRSVPFDTDGMVGLLMVTSPVRLRVAIDDTVAQWLHTVRAFNLAVRDFEHVALGDLRRWSSLARGEPIAKTMFAFETASMNTILRAADPAWERREVQLIEQLEFGLSLETLGDPEIRINVFYDDIRVPALEASRVIGRYEELVRACVEAPHATLGSVCELGSERRRALSGELDDRPEATVADLVPIRIGAHILSHPDRIAIVHDDTQLTYAELGARAAELAAHLAELGAQAGTLVGVAMERTPDMVCALLAVQLAGAAYLPLDPRYPAERLAFMLEDSGTGIVVTDSASLGALPALEASAMLVADALPATSRATAPDRSPTPDDLAYVIYTSGSTGTPKAVMIEHRSVAHLTAWAGETFSDEQRDGVLASTSLSFDFSLFEIVVTLALGGRIVLVEDILALGAEDFSQHVAFVTGVPSALTALLRVHDLPPSVQTVAVGGEVFPPELVDRLYAHESVRSVWNLYGPSEDTMCSTAHRCIPGERPMIGRPLPGTQAYVVDRHERPVPEGVAGELLVGGLGLGRGYLGRAELTAERFAELLLSDSAPARVYRTGDIVRWNERGELDYRGRLDDQVKIRGVRVEPGELEHALREQDAIGDAAVIARGDGPARKLVAYVVGARGAPPDLASVHRALAARLPAPLLPSAIVVLDALPLSANGKLDRQALPEPREPETHGSAVAVTDATQRALAEVWAEVLNLSGPARVDDDFFSLGGDSLNTLHLLAAIEDRFGRRLSVGALLGATTLADQAAVIDSARSEPVASVLVPLRPNGSRPPWICVLTDQRGVIGLRNVLPAVLSDQPVYAMQALDPAAPSWRRSSIEQIAAACVRAVRTHDPHGPYRLGGHSLGGLVAFEMACRLVEAGATVELVILIDTVAPEAFRWPGRIVSRDRTLRGESVVRRARGQANLVRNSLKFTFALARGRGSRPSWSLGLDEDWDQAGAHRITRRYRPARKLSAPMSVLYTPHSAIRMGGPQLGWDRHATGPIRTRSVHGDHALMFSAPDVHDLAAALADELAELDRPPRQP